MAVRIRLRRMGKRNAACHRIVVTDGRKPRDGRFIEILGVYDPRHRNESIDLERADYWLSCGAQPSATVAAIIKRTRAGIPMGHDRETEASAEPETAAAAETETAAADVGGDDQAEPATKEPADAAVAAQADEAVTAPAAEPEADASEPEE